MSILNISGTFGLLGLFKTWSGAPTRIDISSKRPAEVASRRTRSAPMAPVPPFRDADRFFEEDCERWDGLA